MMLSRRKAPDLSLEWRAWTRGLLNVAGMDEVGRGCIAGPVVAAAVVLPPGVRIEGVDDSKRLTPSARTRLDHVIRQRALAVAVGVGGLPVIARDNIVSATNLAMRRALVRIEVRVDIVLVDGRPVPGLPVAQMAIVGGDRCSISVAAASIVAKVWRDRLMDRLHDRFPRYGFDCNRGYATRDHLQALREFGPCPVHRMTFHPVTSY